MIIQRCKLHPALFPLPDSLHHASVSELSCAQFAVKRQRLFELVGFDAPDKEWLASTQRLHERLQRLPELNAESGRLLTCLCGLHTIKHTHTHTQEKNTHTIKHTQDPPNTMPLPQLKSIPTWLPSLYFLLYNANPRPSLL